MDSRFLEQLGALKDPKEALEGYRRLLESTNDAGEKAALILNEVSCLGLLGRFGEARNRLKEANSLVSETNGMRMHVDFAEANLCMAEGKDKEALRKLEKILSDHPKLLQTPTHHFLWEAIEARRGALLANLEQCEEALPILEQVFLRNPDDSATCYYLGHCYCALGEKMDVAKERLIRALQLEPPKDVEFRAHFALGVVHYQLESYARAYEQFRIVADDPDADKDYLTKANIWQWLAWTSQCLGMTEEAERYTKLAKTCPSVKR